MLTLKRLGFQPKTILDIGCHKGEWTRSTRQLFPDAKFVMIDGEYYQEAAEIATANNYTYTVAVLSDIHRTVEWYSIRGTGDSMYRECTRHYDKVKPIIQTTSTLDTLHTNTPVDFIKIDCQGAEIPILKGAKLTLTNVEAILIEMPFVGTFNSGVASFKDHINFMDDLGFVPLDIEELHRPHNILIQLDIVFVRKSSPLLQRVQDVIRAF